MASISWLLRVSHIISHVLSLRKKMIHKLSIIGFFKCSILFDLNKLTKVFIIIGLSPPENDTFLLIILTACVVWTNVQNDWLPELKWSILTAKQDFFRFTKQYYINFFTTQQNITFVEHFL